MEELILDMNKRYSYADYLTWMDDVRRELIDGFIKLMSPAPNRIHQEISVNLERNFINFLYKKQCKIYHAPSDVRFPKNNTEQTDKQTLTVVQPDIYVVCDPSKLDEKGCLGAPDLIIEIVSPRNHKRDIDEKFRLYEENKVREYWIVFPYESTVLVYLLDDNGKYQQKGIFADDDKIPVNIFNGDLVVDLTEVFE